MNVYSPSLPSVSLRGDSISNVAQLRPSFSQLAGAPAISEHTGPAPLANYYNSVIYNSDFALPPTKYYTLSQRMELIKAYSERVVTHIKNIESGSEGERNVKFQQIRKFLEPAGYFSGGLLAAGRDPHEKFTVTFRSYTGRGSPDTLTGTEERTYFAWEIAAGALQHDKVPRGGPINFQFMHIEPKDRSTIDELESLGDSLQSHWKEDVATPMRDASGGLASRSGKADAYVVRGTLQSLVNNNDASGLLSAEGLAAINRTLQKNGQVIIPNIYGYPMAGYAFIPFSEFDGNYANRPNKGVIIDLKNGSAREIHSDADFADWAKHNRDHILNSFNASDKQGGKDAHWPKAGDVLDTLIAGSNATYPGYQNLVKDKEVPVGETFNYTESRGGEYRLKFGDLNAGIAAKFQEVNAKNALWSDQTEVFGSSQQGWKAAKELWSNTFGYVPIVGNLGNVVFGIHDAIDGMTADDRVGGGAAAVISALQLAHEILPVGGEVEPGEPVPTINRSQTEQYTWRRSSRTNEIELQTLPKYKTLDDEAPISKPHMPDVVPTPEGTTSFSGMREVEIRGNHYFAAEHPDAGDGVHFILYLRDTKNPEKLRSSYIIAGLDKKGDWKERGMVGVDGIKRYFSKKHLQARDSLEEVAANYKQRLHPLSGEEQLKLTEKFKNLLEGSNADQYPLVEGYVEAGSDTVNGPLRSGRTSPEIENFLKEFYQMTVSQEKAYRSTFVTAEAAKRIKDSVGKVLQDSGVQSAATTLQGLVDLDAWAQTEPNKEKGTTQKVVYVFDESVPKMNLATEKMPDHLAIGPNEFMKVMAVKESDGTLFVYLSSPTTKPKSVNHIFDGEIAD
ncbi:hypothetical protein [Pseudomonas sp. BIGb0164]|uniref:hypothetical protein n=1 Tax=Pseudomonas sp. BIGb0164 TaxID=2940605 RepID=UPI002166C66E|nr:hypothetical protein [Pseudomonas sp. BIGb0164]MCS4250026.1 hypothetical protein [Pseudomonas sp. BIGb0164]